MKPVTFGVLLLVILGILAAVAGWEQDYRRGTNLALIGALAIPIMTILYAGLQIMWRARKNRK